MSTSRTREIEILIDLVAKLPGLGPRSARRAVLHLIRKKVVYSLHYRNRWLRLLSKPGSVSIVVTLGPQIYVSFVKIKSELTAKFALLKMFRIYGLWKEHQFLGPISRSWRNFISVGWYRA